MPINEKILCQFYPQYLPGTLLHNLHNFVIKRRSLFFFRSFAKERKWFSEDTVMYGCLILEPLHCFLYRYNLADLLAAEPPIFWNEDTNYSIGTVIYCFQCCGSGLFIPDPEFSFLSQGSKRHRTPGSGSATKN
jgi:hypothetical protein